MINNRYIIKKKLGEGRSKVFLCTESNNPDKEFAIKILPNKADTEEIKIFRNEFFILQNLNHPNIIRSHEEGTVVKTDNENGIEPGSRFIVLDFFPGTELLKYEMINDEQTLKFILKQVCSVLYYLHQSNYIYYDLKPENILVKESEGMPVIKLIDMGFAHHLSSSNGFTPRGTSEYIAPEILKNEQHNHQVDLYSLGMMLYKIIYRKFPFSSGNEIDIYKEHIEKIFDFPESRFSADLVELTKKLLEKNPVSRFDNTLGVLRNINSEIDQDIINHFIPANVFADRVEIGLELENFLNENINKEVIILSGAEGSGKTTLLYKIYSDYENIILISSAGTLSGFSFIQYLLNKIIFQEYIYVRLAKETMDLADTILSGSSVNLIANLKTIFSAISSEVKFNLIIDDFNNLDEFTLDVLKEVLPILQVNGINIILSERSDRPYTVDTIINKARIINLPPFTEADLTEFLDKAFASFFPKDQLKKMIIKYADLLPGSVISFIRDLILLKIIKYTFDGAEIIDDDNTAKILESSQDEIFKLRFSQLSPEEVDIVQFLSAFENTPDIKMVSGFSSIDVQGIREIIARLEEKNIIQVSNIEGIISFTSDSLKKYAYSGIKNKENYHSKIAGFIKNNFKDFNRGELARQFELSRDFISSYDILLKEAEEAETLSAYSYEKSILNHLLEFPLPEEKKTALKVKQSLTLYKLSELKSALEIIEDALTEHVSKTAEDELKILKGICLIETGEFAEGKSILNQMIEEIEDEERKQKLLIEIAYAEFDLGKYEVTEDYAKRILNNVNTSVEGKAKCHNLLGLVEIYLRNDLEKALNEFDQSLEYYKKLNSVLQEAKLEQNIGNIYNMKGDHANAEKFWNSAHKKNLSIGNLGQEAKHLLNFGIYNYELASYDEAVQKYKQALDIFSVLGNRFGEGLALTNLGEINTDRCSYQEAFDSLIKARDIFNSLNNVDEEAEVLFLTGKLFSVVGSEIELTKTINEYKKIITDGSARHLNNIKYLEYLLNNKNDSELISEIRNKYQQLNDNTNYVKTNIIFCEALLADNKITRAFDIINEEEFLQVCSKNLIIRAYREFLIGRIAENAEQVNIPNPLNNYSASYEILRDNFITELTWKVMLKIGEIYFERGNFTKAGEYIIYSKKLIYFIADHLKNPALRESYLNHKDRKKAVERLEFLENEVSS